MDVSKQHYFPWEMGYTGRVTNMKKAMANVNMSYRFSFANTVFYYTGLYVATIFRECAGVTRVL